MNDRIKKSVHMSLQGKGGVGKSMSMAILMQYLRKNGLDPLGYDTDTENKTLHHYKDLTVVPVDILDANNRINERLFDLMLEDILGKDGVHVIDNGANSFRPMVSYIGDNDVIKVFQETGSHLYLHTVISGGPDLNDTLASFRELTRVARASTAEEGSVSIVLWLNRHHGPVDRDGQPVMMAPVITNAGDMISGAINLGINASVKEDIERMNSLRLTFDEFDRSGALLMSRRRVASERDRIFAELDQIDW